MSQLFDPNWQRASILPVGRNKQTGQLAPATPQAVVDLLSALMLPGDVYKGNVLLNDPETGHTNMDVIKRSADLAGNLTLGSTGAVGAARMAAGKRVVDPNVVNIFAGPTAKTADKAALKAAQDMAEKGVDRKAIWDATGWFKGTDGKWRFEIDDSQSTFGGELQDYGWNGPFGDALQHPELARAYPDTQGMDSAVSWQMQQGGSYDGGVPFETDNGTLRSLEEIRAQGFHPDQLRETLLHEGQHAVQAREGFAAGGNYDMGRQLSAEPLNGDIQALTDYINTTKRTLARASSIGPFERDQLNMLADAERELADLQRQASVRPSTAFDAYSRIAGEVEARNVEARKNMNMQERRAIPPWETQEFPDDQQFIRFR
jgi:hypothetical protein